MSKIHVKKGDKVIVIAGNSKGEQGIITQVFPKNEKAIVEGLNKKKKHNKPTSQSPTGSISEIEAPIHVSNLKVVKG
jgi:large subunit ribosomal protein L24